MFSPPRTAPLPPEPAFEAAAAAVTDENSSAFPTAASPRHGRDRALPPSPRTACVGGSERHIDKCDYCKKVHRRARSRSRSRSRSRARFRRDERCRHGREHAEGNSTSNVGRREHEQSSSSSEEDKTPRAERSGQLSNLHSANTAGRTLVSSSRHATGDSTPRNDSSLPPYVSNPPSETGGHDRGRRTPNRSRSTTLGATSAPRIPESTLAFVRDQQHRQFAQQQRDVVVDDGATGEDLGEVPLARIPQAADPLRVRFVPSHNSASATAGSSDPHPRQTSMDRAHDSAQSIVAQMRLQERDERLCTLLDECVRDSRQPLASNVFAKASDRQKETTAHSHHLVRRHRKPSSLIDSVLGFDEVNPQDLIYGDGSKVDGGFGYTLPSQYREGSILLDAEAPPLPQESPSAVNKTTTTFSSTLTSYLKRSASGSSAQGRQCSSQEERTHGARHQASSAAANAQVRESTGSTSSSIFAFGLGRKTERPTSLSDRINRANLRPRHLDLSCSQEAKTQERGPSRLRQVTTADHSGDNEGDSGWEDVQLRPKTSTGKNAKLAEALGVERPATAEARFERGEHNTLTNEKRLTQRASHFSSAGTDPTSLVKRRTNESFLRDSNAAFPTGMSEADIVAICLMQGMVPPGLPRDDTLVTWSGPLSPTNPRNWHGFYKWYACIFVALATFLANAGTNMVAPALGLISDSYEEVYVPSYRGFLIGSYVFAFALAPLLYGPLSELLGRKPVLIFGTTLFWSANLLCAFVDASWELMILRFLSALGASAPMAIGGAVLTDIFPPERRGRAMTVFALAPQLGPVLGPIMGGWVAQETRDWRLIFWVAAAAGFFVAFFIVFMRESYTPQILARRAKRLRKQTGNAQLTTIFERRQESVRQVLTRGMIRPLVLFWCEPIVQLLCLYVSLIYGVMHLVTATFPAVFGTIYSEYPGWASMHFIGIGVGTIAGGILGGYLIERYYHRLALRNNGVGKPEHKIYSFLYSVWLPPLGLLVYGLVTYYGVHWIFADAGIVLFCLGISMAIVAIQSYIVDCYALLAGSALTSTIVFRSIVGTGATIAAEDLLLEGGMLWSNVALATACVVIGVPVAFTIYFCGARLRQRSRHATHKR